MAKAPGIDRRDFVAGTVALGAAGAAVDIVSPAAAAAQDSREKTMTTARERILEFGRARRA